MNNNRGFILVFTAAFVLGFAMLGMAAVQWGGADHEVADAENFSAQALWLADGAVERTRAKLLNSSMPDQVDVPGIGTSKIWNIIETSPSGVTPKTWVVQTSGEVPFGNSGLKKERFIQTTIVRPIFPVIGDGSLIATDGINCPNGSGNQPTLDPVTGKLTGGCLDSMANGAKVEPALTFLNTFGVTFDQAKALAAWITPPNSGPYNFPGLSNITYVHLTDTNTDPTFNIGVMGGNGLLIIDASDVTYSNAIVKLNGTSTFTGMIWVKNASVTLGSNASLFTGILFVEGGVSNDDVVNINSHPNIASPGTNPNFFSNSGLDKPVVTAWQECSDNTFTHCGS